MTARDTLLALAALTTLSLSALAPTSASASDFGQGFHGNGFYGQDTPRRGQIWAPQHRHVDPCECETPVRHTYVPVRVPVYVPVKVKVPVYVPVKVKVPVYVPVKQAEPCDCEAPIPTRQTYVPAPRPSHIEAAPQQTAEPCDCEEPEFTQGPQTRPPHTYPGTGPQYDQNRRPANFASSEIEKK